MSSKAAKKAATKRVQPQEEDQSQAAVKAGRKQRRKQEGGCLLDSSFKLREVKPLTTTQEDVIRAYGEGHNIFMYGVAGTGKSFLSLYLAFQNIINDKSNNYHKIYIVRSAVASRSLGFLPGDPNEKVMIYEEPYIGIVNNLFSRGDAWETCKRKGIIEFRSTSYLRGITLDNCIILFDEVQNCRFEELDTLTTRYGKNCRLMICGDLEQSDLTCNKNDVTGLPRYIKIIKSMDDYFRFIEFNVGDIVRSGFVKDYITKKHELEHPAPGMPAPKPEEVKKLEIPVLVKPEEMMTKYGSNGGVASSYEALVNIYR